MQIAINRGLERFSVDLDENRCVGVFRGPAALPDPAAFLHRALEDPTDYPALRRALTPDDRVALVLDEQLPQTSLLLTEVLRHIHSAGVALDSVSIVCSERGTHGWIDELPDEVEDVHVEDHDPAEPRRLAYLATTQGGRRLYLSRTVVEADQVVVLTGLRFDPILGWGGGAGAIFPALSDRPTIEELAKHAVRGDPREAPSGVRDEAHEASWLLGQPFYIQLVHAGGDGIAEVITGANDAVELGRQRLDESWTARVPRLADVALVSLSGDPVRHTFADLARAAYTASRVVTGGGRVVLLCDAAPPLSPGLERLTRGEEPEDVLRSLRRSDRLEDIPLTQWTRTLATSRISLWSRLPAALVEDIGAIPLSSAAEVQRLVADGAVVVFEDGHRWVSENVG